VGTCAFPSLFFDRFALPPSWAAIIRTTSTDKLNSSTAAQQPQPTPAPASAAAAVAASGDRATYTTVTRKNYLEMTMASRVSAMQAQTLGHHHRAAAEEKQRRERRSTVNKAEDGKDDGKDGLGTGGDPDNLGHGDDVEDRVDDGYISGPSHDHTLFAGF